VRQPIISQFPLASGSFVAKVVLKFHPPIAAVFSVLTKTTINSVKIFSGTANVPLARAICKSIGSQLGKCSVQPFPDGETFVKIEEMCAAKTCSSSSRRRRRRITI